jgi:ATP-dependent helicase/nuclease subunit A
VWAGSTHSTISGRAGGPTTEVWRERAFEIVLDGAWVTGVFDRVVVARDAAGSTLSASSGQAGSPQAGRAVRATVFDFKTDRLRGGGAEELGEAAARHAGQMALYRRAAARLLALPEDAVTAELVFTAVRARVSAV